ncbi:MAG: flagellar biosynthesis anti-sigma factor FlgM [Epsilonproteobacteria bacterium]|nr:flagellar biosynthesis anti-sigma factor FlgM [Campylobacterota bacterium]
MIQNVGVAQGAARHGDIKEMQKNQPKTAPSREGGESKVEKIRAMIEKGEYQVDLRAVAEKMAEQLRPGE